MAQTAQTSQAAFVRRRRQRVVGYDRDNGRAVAGTSGRTSPVYNPATGRQTGALDLATVEEVDLAVQTAKEAFETCRSVSLAVSASPKAAV